MQAGFSLNIHNLRVIHQVVSNYQLQVAHWQQIAPVTKISPFLLKKS